LVLLQEQIEVIGDKAQRKISRRKMTTSNRRKESQLHVVYSNPYAIPLITSTGTKYGRCSMHGRCGIQHRYFVGKPSNKKPYWRSTRDGRTTITHIKEIPCDGVT